jgi:hypothetical protein
VENKAAVATRAAAPQAPQVARRVAPPVAWRRALFLLPAGAALAAGLDAALLLLGLPAPVSLDRLADVHGMLLVFGFVGTLVSLERAVALRLRAGFAAPAFLGLGALALISPAPLEIGQVLMVLGAMALTGVYVPLWRRQRDHAVLVQSLGAVLAVGALMLWLGGAPVPVLLPWLVGFLVLTICGERLELARVAMGPRAGTILTWLSAALVSAVVATLLWPAPGVPLLGLVLLVLVGWLSSHDVSRRTVRVAGQPRFMAVCMLAGYLWLGVAGAVWTVGGPAYDGARYDAVVHAVFLGFTISMVLAHASVILPAVLRRPLPHRSVFWAPVALLHGSLLLRLWLGDGLGVEVGWRLGGLANIAALLLFVALAAWSTVAAPPGDKVAR